MDPSCRFRSGAITAVALLFVAASPGASQSLEGRVLRGETPASGAMVTLHHVTRSGGGPVDSVHTDAGGRFRLSLPEQDTGSFNVVFATAEYLGVRYFGEVLHQEAPGPDYIIEVFDTISAPRASFAPRISRRDMLFIPDPGGGWEVNEIVQLANPGNATLVSAGAEPTVEVRLPMSVDAFEVGEGQVRSEDVRRMGSRVFVMAPLTPGVRDLMLRYRLPPNATAELPLAVPTDTFNVFVRQPAPDLRITGLAEVQGVVGEGERFRLFSGTDLEAKTVSMTWSDPRAAPIAPATAAIGATVLVLLVGAGAALLRRRPPESDVEPGGEGVEADQTEEAAEEAVR
jgi:hypothetical protein